MEFLTIILAALALSMDAFAVSICFGACAKHKRPVALRVGVFFGLFPGFNAFTWMGCWILTK